MARIDLGSDEDCLAALAPLFEGAPRFLARLCARRPFGDAATMFAIARDVARAMPELDQIELIDAHPRLGAPPGSVSALSFIEQGYDQESAFGETAPGEVAAELEPERDPAAAELESEPERVAAGLESERQRVAAGLESERQRVAAELDRMNAAYEARFGFRYCVFVAGRPRAALVPGFEAALSAERAVEIARAVKAVIDIARDRWTTTAADPS